jgi:hypothetical protein
MALTSSNLTDIGLGAGVTPNFTVQYESSLPNQSRIIAHANALLAVVETEFQVTTGWFGTPPGKFGPDHRQQVNLDKRSGAGGSNAGYGSAISIDSQNDNADAADAAERVKMIFMNEWVEILMDLTGGRWNRGDSTGEGLSQYCGIIRFPAGHYSYYPSWVNSWLATSRQDFVTRADPTDADPKSFGCALAFIFYLNTQWGFTIRQIIQTRAINLFETYEILTGERTNPFPEFSRQLGIIYPGPATIARPNSDNPYPIGKKILWHNSLTEETQIWFMNDEWVARRATVLDENGAAIFVGPPWRITGTTDMARDGGWIIAWHNGGTDQTQIWFMNGDRITRRANVVDENGAGIVVGPPWRIVGTADMDRSGQPDIVWHNSWTGETQIWFMNGERIVRRANVLDEHGAGIVIGPPFRIVGTADMDGDGRGHRLAQRLDG